MERNSKGEWYRVLDLLPGDYEYQAVVDGRWLSDPAYTIPQAEPDPIHEEHSDFLEKTAFDADHEPEERHFLPEIY